MSDHHTQDVASAAAGADTTGSATPPRRRLRRPGRVAVAVAAFLAGATFSGAGAVWAGHQFSDVPSNHQFHGDIAWLADNGIANGYADGTFKPTAPVSRQAMAAFLHRYNDGLELVAGPTVNPGAGTQFVASVTCPEGKHPVAGSAFSLDLDIVLTFASPTYGRTYQARWVSRSGASVNPSSISVSALCIPD